MMTGQRSDYDDEDDFYPFEDARGSLAHVVYDVPRPGPQFIGLLDHRGSPIFRVSPPKPPIGFSSDPGINSLFEFNPDTDFFYTSDVADLEEEDLQGDQ
jgi:hypothetical protein